MLLRIMGKKKVASMYADGGSKFQDNTHAKPANIM